MANEADSRSTTPFPRWSETAAQVPSVNVTEPSGGKKDVGWLPGADGVVGEWWNWLHWAAGVFFRYLENWLGLAFVDNALLAGTLNTEGVITAGVGLSVDITACRLWITGAMYKVPAAVNLALAAADPTNPRIDLIYAKVSAGSPSYDKVTGTPAAIPAVPTLPAGGCVIGTVRVNATAVVPGTIGSLREFGRLALDRFVARARIDIGDPLAPTVKVDTVSGLGNGLWCGIGASPLFQANVDLGYILLEPEAVNFTAPIIRRCDVDGSELVLAGGSSGSLSILSDGSCKLTGGAIAYAAVRIPNGATITAVRAHGTKVSSLDDFHLGLFRRDKSTGTFVDLTTSPGNAGAALPFLFSVALIAPESVSQDATYVVRVFGDATLFSATVEYTETKPFDGL